MNDFISELFFGVRWIEFCWGCLILSVSFAIFVSILHELVSPDKSEVIGNINQEEKSKKGE